MNGDLDFQPLHQQWDLNTISPTHRLGFHWLLALPYWCYVVVCIYCLGGCYIWWGVKSEGKEITEEKAGGACETASERNTT